MSIGPERTSVDSNKCLTLEPLRVTMLGAFAFGENMKKLHRTVVTFVTYIVAEENDIEQIKEEVFANLDNIRSDLKGNPDTVSLLASADGITEEMVKDDGWNGGRPYGDTDIAIEHWLPNNSEFLKYLELKKKYEGGDE